MWRRDEDKVAGIGNLGSGTFLLDIVGSRRWCRRYNQVSREKNLCTDSWYLTCSLQNKQYTDSRFHHCRCGTLRDKEHTLLLLMQILAYISYK